jgi:hypothetical protein
MSLGGAAGGGSWSAWTGWGHRLTSRRRQPRRRGGSGGAGSSVIVERIRSFATFWSKKPRNEPDLEIETAIPPDSQPCSDLSGRMGSSLADALAWREALGRSHRACAGGDAGRRDAAAAAGAGPGAPGPGLWHRAAIDAYLVGCGLTRLGPRRRLARLSRRFRPPDRFAPSQARPTPAPPPGGARGLRQPRGLQRLWHPPGFGVGRPAALHLGRRRRRARAAAARRAADGPRRKHLLCALAGADRCASGPPCVRAVLRAAGGRRRRRLSPTQLARLGHAHARAQATASLPAAPQTARCG